jgi:hypothetical protein
MAYQSADILNLTLSVCVAALTVFLCFSMYYFIASLKGVYSLIKKVEVGVEKAENLLDLAGEKLKNSAAYLTIFGELFKKGIEIVKEKAAARKNSLKRKK